MTHVVSRSGAVLEPAGGPEDPPSSRPHAGVLGGAVRAYRFAPGQGVQRIPLPDDVVPGPDTVLHWAYYADGPAAALAPHAALAVAVDVVFGDGTRLADDPGLRDRYGFPLDAQAQFDACWSMPEQWNADSVALGAHAGRTGRIEVVLGAPSLVAPGAERADEQVTGFVEVRVERAPAHEGADPSPAERVDTRRGSHAGSRFSRGNTIPITAAPHGFCFLTPATDASDARWPYQPFVHDEPGQDGAGVRRLEAVQFSHQPSPWIGDHGVLQLMPFTAEPHSDRTARRRGILPNTERARPHVYAAALTGGLRLEVTATDHGGAFRALADDPGEAVGFVLDQIRPEGRLIFAADGVSFSGWVPEGDPGWGNPPRTYFAGRVVQSTVAYGALSDAGRERVAGYVAGRGSIEVRIALSYLSVAQAERNLALELPDAVSFEVLRDALRERWDALLGAVQIPALPAESHPGRALAHEEDAARIASALYRLHLYPCRIDENTGTAERPVPRYADATAPAAPHGETETGAVVRDGEAHVTNGYWDTYRTAWPLLGMLDPAGTGAMLDGLLRQWRDGGWMARWSAPGYVDCMVGTSSDQIFADAARRGLPFDAAAAFESAWRNASEPSADPRVGRKGIGAGRFLGWIPSSVREGMSWSIENAISDAGIAHLSDALAADPGADPLARARYRAFSRSFRNRALAHRSLFDAETGFFRGRDEEGSFSDAPFDPRIWGGDYVETNAWGMSVSAVHDGAGLAALHGGPAGLRAHLDRLFAEPETADPAFGGTYGTVIHEQREARALRSGMCAISNQPAHHIPWMHVFGDEPWRAGATVHALARRLFTGAMIAQGFPGDEDNGETSAWWLWAALGLYPLELGAGVLRIGAPLLDDVTVRRTDGRALRIRTQRESPDATLLAEARLDGVPLQRPLLDVRVLDRGADAVLDLVLTADPGRAAASPLWAPTGPEAQSDGVQDAAASSRRPGWRADLTGPVVVPGAERAGSPGVPLGADAVAALFADGDDAAVPLAEGEVAGWRFAAPTTVTDVTLTAVAHTSADALAWERSTDGETWIPISTTHREDLPADRTVPFVFAAPVTTALLRVRATVPVVLRQIELFDLGDPAGASRDPATRP
ncbi:alpha-1,2-mannosidase, putative [Microbacterium azadirachtae]|uniref:Alpha-1,2-mannosidase, putative n=1 Tax=Microbacterium azadirachtae TaxID=582680 RepID=A0A1I6I3N8_9MICO|nr:GH92 family glycosyl hydrolase [Microbacterium azadirachtae]SFR61030.1 alpha-1,2-mannosidase, putative [Microbacterium azadirachtae]